MSELTVLGSCGAWPEPGRACAGFLLVHEGFKVVLDLGCGAASRLFEHCPGGRVDAVVVTHEHPDHCADVSALGRARAYGLPDEPRIPLRCTPGTVRRLEAREPRPHPTTIFDVYDPGSPLEIGPFRMTTFLLPHHVPNHGVRLTAPGLTVAYTGDSGPSPILAELARDADLVIADATVQGPFSRRDAAPGVDGGRGRVLGRARGCPATAADPLLARLRPRGLGRRSAEGVQRRGAGGRGRCPLAFSGLNAIPQVKGMSRLAG